MMTEMMQTNVALPYGVTPECPTAALLRRIDAELESRGLWLCWFRSAKSSNPANVTITAAIFPRGVRTTSHGRECRQILASWRWCPRVGKTARSAQYRDLLDAWNAYLAPEQVNPPSVIAAIDDAPDFDAEQRAIATAGATCDLLIDLPRDASRCWSIHCSKFNDNATRVYAQIARRLGLVWERGARRHYVVGRPQLSATYAALARHGFVVALGSDAMLTYNSD